MYKNVVFGCLKSFGVFAAKNLYEFSVEGKENLVPGKAIISINHNSLMDPVIAMAAVERKIYFMCRRFWGMNLLLSGTGQVLLNGREMDNKQYDDSLKVLERGEYLGVFGEGTRSFDGTLGEIKKGIAYIAYNTQTPIIPMIMHGTYEVWPRTKSFPKLCGKINIKIGKAIIPQKNDNYKNSREIVTDLTEIVNKDMDELFLR